MKKFLLVSSVLFVFAVTLSSSGVIFAQASKTDAVEKLKEIQKELRESYKINDEGELKKFLGEKKKELEALVPELSGDDLENAYMYLIQISSFLEHFEEALEFCEKMLSLELTPQQKVGVYFQKLDILGELGEFEEILKLVDSCVEEFKDNENIVLNLKATKAQTLIYLDKIDEAKKLFDELKETKDKRLKAYIENSIKNLELIGKAPTSFNEKSITGEEFSLEKYKGKWILIDFWATWCGPCVDEMPNVKEAYSKYKDKGFVILGISLDKDEKKLKDFLEKNEIEWPQYFDGKGWKNKLALLYEVNSIPHTILVSPEGKIYRVNLRGKSLQNTLKKIFEKN